MHQRKNINFSYPQDVRVSGKPSVHQNAHTHMHFNQAHTSNNSIIYNQASDE